MYGGLLWFFLIGALCPFCAWIISLKWPNSIIRYIKYVSICLACARKLKMSTQLPRNIHWNVRHTTSNSRQLRAMGNRRFHIPVCYPPPPFLMVDKVQLYVSFPIHSQTSC
jgi:hypothetical protein